MKYAIGLIAVAVIVSVVIIIRSQKADEIVSLIVHADEQESPLDSLPIKKWDIRLDNRVLKANFLLVDESAPAVFICTGNGEALFEWLPVQKYFMDKGFSSYIFSYSGFGNSTGTTTENSLYEDAMAAYDQFVSLTPKSKRRIAMSHSLGCVPVHGIADKMDPAPSKLVIHAPFYSIQQLLVDLEMASPSTRWLWPDIWNNMDYARDIEIPTLYVHSKNDQTVPFRHSQELVKAAGNHASILLLEDYGHNAIYKNVSDSLYLPILDFINE